MAFCKSAHYSSSCSASVLKVVENNEGGGLNNGAVGVEWKSCLETMEIVGVVAMGEEVSTTGQKRFESGKVVGGNCWSGVAATFLVENNAHVYTYTTRASMCVYYMCLDKGVKCLVLILRSKWKCFSA